MIYVIGSLKNPEIPLIANRLREAGHEVFDDWHAAGPDADDYWQMYEQRRGHGYIKALKGYPARHVYEYDKHHLDRADIGLLVLPAGKSAHLELGYLIGRGRATYILLDGDPERYDVMYQFAKGVFNNIEELLDAIRPS